MVGAAAPRTLEEQAGGGRQGFLAASRRSTGDLPVSSPSPLSSAWLALGAAGGGERLFSARKLRRRRRPWRAGSWLLDPSNTFDPMRPEGLLRLVWLDSIGFFPRVARKKAPNLFFCNGGPRGKL